MKNTILDKNKLVNSVFSKVHQKYDFNGLPKIHEHDGKRPQAFGIIIDGRLVCLYTYETDLSDGSSWTGVVSSLDSSGDSRTEGTHKISYTLDSHGFFSKPADWKGRRESPGQLQEAISQIIIARNEFSTIQFCKVG